MTSTGSLRLTSSGVSSCVTRHFNKEGVLFVWSRLFSMHCRPALFTNSRIISSWLLHIWILHQLGLNAAGLWPSSRLGHVTSGSHVGQGSCTIVLLLRIMCLQRWKHRGCGFDVQEHMQSRETISQLFNHSSRTSADVNTVSFSGVLTALDSYWHSVHG